MKLAVITDSSATIATRYKGYANLFILDIAIAVDEEDVHSSEIADELFYDKMAKAKNAPKTAQPSLAELTELLQQLQKEQYTHVLGLFLSSEISGFYANAYYLQGDFDGMLVKFPETHITSAPLGYMVETALDLAAAGQSWETLLAKFEAQEQGDQAYMLVDDLKWLSKSGRLSNGSAILGTLLNIKPVLTFSQDGKVEVFDKVRTTKKTMARLKELLLAGADREADKVYIIHARAEDKAQELFDFAKAQGYADLEIVTFGAVVATHLGLGSVAYAWTARNI